MRAAGLRGGSFSVRWQLHPVGFYGFVWGLLDVLTCGQRPVGRGRVFQMQSVRRGFLRALWAPGEASENVSYSPWLFRDRVRSYLTLEQGRARGVRG